MSDLVHTIAAILDPKAWDGIERTSERQQAQIRHRQTSSAKRARAIVAAVAVHIAEEGKAADA